MEERLLENKSGLSWFVSAMQQSTTIQGRARRREYWWFQLFVSIIGLGLMLMPLITIGVVGLYSIESEIPADAYLLFAPAILMGMLALGFIIITMVPSLTVLIRRMHDNDMPGWVVLLQLVPLGEFALLYFCLKSGTPGQNRYGSNPKSPKLLDPNAETVEEASAKPPVKHTVATNILSLISPIYGFILARSFRNEHKSVSSMLIKWSAAGMVVAILLTTGITALLYLDAKETEHLLSAKAASILEGEEYFYEGIFYDGGTMDGDTLGMAAQGDDFVFVFYDPSGQEYARVAGFEGWGYEYDATQDTYVSYSDYDNVTYAFPALTYEDSGMAKVELLNGVNDNALKYEEYSYENGSDKATIRFYFQNDKLYCIEESFTGMDGNETSEVIVIKEIKDSVPLEWFEVDGVY